MALLHPKHHQLMSSSDFLSYTSQGTPYCGIYAQFLLKECPIIIESESLRLEKPSPAPCPPTRPAVPDLPSHLSKGISKKTQHTAITLQPINTPQWGISNLRPWDTQPWAEGGSRWSIGPLQPNLSTVSSVMSCDIDGVSLFIRCVPA